MIIKYGNEKMIPKREKKAEKILQSLPFRYCFITGSFLYQEKYKDIDVFIITRSKKDIELKDKKINITKISFNELYGLFYHSIKKSCVAKNILPERTLRITISNYWDVINEAVPTILNEKNKYRKEVRDLVLYTEYFKRGIILSSKELNKKIAKFKDYKELLKYIKIETPKIVTKKISKGYAKRFLYTWAGQYKDMLKYDSHKLLYNLTHTIVGAKW